MVNFFYEDLLEPQPGSVVVGVDEVGYGALAGPVVAAAAYIPDRNADYVANIKDSKALSSTKREAIFEELKLHAVFGVGSSNVEEIEEHNILVASHMAMRRALDNLSLCLGKIDLVLVDGVRNLDSAWRTEAIVKGDSLSKSIAAASIVAKVTRDRLMSTLHTQFAEYAWNKNCGYGTKAHMEALSVHGITPHHRRTFSPVKNLAQHSLQNVHS
ncbi:ribonuclease HII [Candidatus Anaplasma sp. TIGMIC]|uniref:ribonuclease HII n=1 Tax=Candidatus Anaplasma sp. TIGMIC TaxID=3020713 RepID=UPI002330A331|nr:ribonuclease HII [Candidatus Anaplasma sp. TIGMIC]MDB1135359.1 ribonuclease HII [Candidatus Anaplasma sp. TIGMIC]